METINMRYFDNKNEWAVILGGSSGMGLAIANKLAQEGMNLLILHRDRRSQMERVEQSFAELNTYNVKVLTLNKDALKEETIEESIALLKNSFGENNSIKLLLHAVSKGNLKPFISNNKKEISNDKNLYSHLTKLEREVMNTIKGQLTATDLEQTTSSMAFSILPWIHQLIENKLFSNDARIIGLTSEGNKRYLPAYGAVAAAKSALESILTSLSVELAPLGIRVNIIQAGVTKTPSLELIPGSRLIMENAIYRNPMGRLTTAEDVANVTYLLCRDEASWINGALIPVDGGEKNK